MPPVTSARLAGLLLLPALLLAGGCGHYEYDVVEPPDLAQRIGTKTPAAFTLEPIRYEASSYSDRLILVVHNEADEPVKLFGEDSFVVDPRGESHAMPTRTIAPGTSTKLIFPPVRPTFRQSSFGVGVGVGVSRSYGRRGYYRGGFAGDPYFYDDYPRYYVLQDDGTLYWEWDGDGTVVKVRLVYQLGEKRFHHDFTFRRVKALRLPVAQVFNPCILARATDEDTG